jgi:raffinose/stachyose/melibiose transport system substrate-binding protein/xylobiose transport system substrate-binding protein
MKRPVHLRAATVVAAVTALALTNSACGSGGPGSSGSGRVTVWTLQNTTLNPVQQKSLDTYNTHDHKAKASIHIFVNDPYKQKLQTVLGSAGAPDVFLNWGGGNLSQYVATGDVADIGSRLPSAFKDQFLPSVLAGGTVNGKLYGIPMEGVQPVALFYNKTVFAKAGITDPPATWQQLLADIGRLKARHITPIALAGSQSWTELMWLEYLLDRIGGPQAFAAIQAGKAGAWDNPAVATALGMIRDLVDRGAFGTKYPTLGQDSGGANTLLSSGKAGMMLMGSWAYTDLLSTAPAFVKARKLGWTAFPTVPKGIGNPKDAVGNPSNYFSVASGSKNKTGAVDFIAKTVSQPSYIADLLSIGQVPAIAGIKGQLMGAANPEYTGFVYGLVVDAPTFTQSWDQALSPDISALLLSSLQKVFNKRMSPEQFVHAMNAS